MFLLKRSYASIVRFNLISITAVSYGGIAINLFPLNYKNHRLNRTTRILTSSSYDANADDLFVILGWKKLNLQRELKTATMVYKSLNGLAPDYLKSMFTDRSAISTYFCGISRSGWFNKHLGLYLSFSPLYCSFVRTFVLINLIALIVDLKLQHSLHFIITSVNALATYVRPQT